MNTGLDWNGRPAAGAALVIAAALAALGCGPARPPAADSTATATATPTDAPTGPPADPAEQETARLDQFFTNVYMRTVKRNPMIQGYLGLKMDTDKWNDISDARALEDHELAKGDLKALRTQFDIARLDRQGALSYRLFERRLQQDIDDFKWRFHGYPVNQMFGLHSQIPAFLSNFHAIDNEADAVAYIARLRALPALFEQLEAGLVTREKMGILPPAFVFPMVLEDCRNIIGGAPFDGSGADSPILADFRAKVEALDGVGAAGKRALIDRATSSLKADVGPAYTRLIALLDRQRQIATTDDGAWKWPDGAAFYARALERTTTVKMSAEDIHALGLREVDRIYGEMRAIMQKVAFTGSLQDFFAFIRTDPQFYYPNTDEGRQAYLKAATEVIAQMETRLDELFITKPKAAILVKRVEAYREKSAGTAFYSGPSLDGKRPGTYYVNLYDMGALPKYELEALAFHEGIPGHHMQHSIAMELDGLPMFRRLLGYTAYGEGWGLYSERLGKELGFYKDPYSDFGRLSMELWRACRLVIDTGLHHKRWTREKAIAWLTANTPGSERDVRKAVERYIVAPSQATAYTIGMLEILRLRAVASQALGERFDLRAFHDLVLTNGPLPLPFLEEQVEAWIAAGTM